MCPADGNTHKIELAASASKARSRPADTTSSAQSANGTHAALTIGRQESLRSTSRQTDQFSGTATTVSGVEGRALTAAHRKRLMERGLDPDMCVRLGVHSHDSKTLAFDYIVDGEVHNTKLRRGKGNMPWTKSGQDLVLWNIDCLKPDPEPDEFVIITEGELDAASFLQAGFTRVVSVPNGAQTSERGFQYLGGHELHPDLAKFGRFVIGVDNDSKGIACRDALAVRLGDDCCRWVRYPAGCKDANDVIKRDSGHTQQALVDAVFNAAPMWTDEVCTISEIPDPPEDEPRYRTGILGLDHHGLRITLPCFMPLIGPYGSGKSVLLRQLLCNFYELHGWRSLLTAFEEKIKPRYQRDLRRHFIGRASKPPPGEHWTEDELAAADKKIEDAFVFFRRAKRKVVDVETLLQRIEFAVRVYGLRVVAIDPANEVQLVPAKGQLKTDLMGEFMMRLKDLADDYNLLIIVCAHTSVASTEKKLKGKSILTLNDGEDTRHWGGKADIGFCVWRPLDGPTILNIDKIKDHETMGKPTLVRLALDRGLGAFSVEAIGYDEVMGNAAKGGQAGS